MPRVCESLPSCSISGSVMYMRSAWVGLVTLILNTRPHDETVYKMPLSTSGVAMMLGPLLPATSFAPPSEIPYAMCRWETLSRLIWVSAEYRCASTSWPCISQFCGSRSAFNSRLFDQFRTAVGDAFLANAGGAGAAAAAGGAAGAAAAGGAAGAAAAGGVAARGAAGAGAWALPGCDSTKTAPAAAPNHRARLYECLAFINFPPRGHRLKVDPSRPARAGTR